MVIKESMKDVKINFSQEKYDVLFRLAGELGLNVSSYIRMLVFEQLKKQGVK